MEFLASTFWFFIFLILLLTLRRLRPLFAKWFKSEERKSILVQRFIFYLFFWPLLAAFVYRFPLLSPFYQKIASSSLLAVFFGHSIYNGKQFLDKPKLSRTVTFSILTLIACYGILIAWEQAPHPLHISEWFHHLPNYSQQLVSISLSLVAAVFCYSVGFDIAHRITQKTESTLDDRLISLFQVPASLSVFFIGINYGITISDLSDFWSHTYHGASLSLLIILWSTALLKSSTIFLEGMRASQTNFKVLNARTIPIFHLLARIFIIITAIYLLLLAWGINVMLWITSAGIIGIAIAYASQDTLASLFAGIAILSDAPYKLGDFLVLEDGKKGKVTHIGFRSTRMLTIENIEIIIPNSILASAQIINMSGGNSQHARIDISAGVAYGSDIDRVREILYEIAKELEYVVHDHEFMTPKVHFISMGASSLDFILRIWISNPEEILNIQDQANTLIYKCFTKEDIEIPYAKQDVYLYPMDEISIKK